MIVSPGLDYQQYTPVAYRVTSALASSCLRSWQTDFGVTLGGTPRASGILPPEITFSGVAMNGIAPRIEIQSPGVLGAGPTFRYSASNTGLGANDWIAQNVPLNTTAFDCLGGMKGITINFLPSEMYNTGVVYQGTVANWRDIKNGGNAAQIVPSEQPIAVRVDNRMGIRFDGIAMKLFDSVYDFAAPSTTPTWVCGCFALDSWVISRSMMGGSSNSAPQLSTNTASPGMISYNGVSSPINNGLVIGRPAILEDLFSNTPNDYLRLGGTTVSGVATGNLNSPAGWYIGAVQNGAFGACTWFSQLHFNAMPSPDDLRAIQGALYALYPNASR